MQSNSTCKLSPNEETQSIGFLSAFFLTSSLNVSRNTAIILKKIERKEKKIRDFILCFTQVKRALES